MRAAKYLFLPLYIHVAYIIFSFLLSLVGPWQYVNYKFWISGLFICSYLTIFTLFFKSGINRGIEPTNIGFRIRELIRFIDLSILSSLILNLLLFYERLTKYGLFNYKLSDIGFTYFDALKRIKEIEDISRITQINTLLGIFKLISIILGLYYFDKLKIISKLLFVLVVLLIVLNSVLFIGTQKALGDITIYFFSVILLKYNRQIKKYLVLSVTMIITFFIFMIFVQYARLYAIGIDFYSFKSNPLLILKENYFLFSILGRNLGLAAAIVVLYISMGYYGLSLSLQQEFIWTYGIGNSFALESYAAQYLGVKDMLLFTYPMRVEFTTGWPALMYWHTIFPWLASDFTFLGSLIILGIVARIYSITWKEAIIYKNALSILLFSHLNILWLFIPQNNQLFQTRESLISTVVLFVAWILYHRHLNNKKSQQ